MRVIGVGKVSMKLEHFMIGVIILFKFLLKVYHLINSKISPSYQNSSIVFYMVKRCWILNAFNQLLPILYVRPEVTNFRVEDIAQTMLSHKLMRQNADAFLHFIVELV